MFKLKSKLIIVVMVIFSITAFMSCEKEQVNIVKTPTSQQNNYDKMINLNETDEKLVDLSRKEDLKNYNEKLFGKLNLKEAFLYYPSFDTSYYCIIINSSDTYENNIKKVLTRLLVVINKSDNTTASIVLRVEAKKEKQTIVSGQETYYSSVGGYIGCKLYNTDNLLFKPLSNYLAKSQYENFNDCYQSKKEICENDWLCDLACSLAPCGISYAAGCLIEDLSGNIDDWN